MTYIAERVTSLIAMVNSSNSHINRATKTVMTTIFHISKGRIKEKFKNRPVRISADQYIEKQLTHQKDASFFFPSGSPLKLNEITDSIAAKMINTCHLSVPDNSFHCPMREKPFPNDRYMPTSIKVDHCPAITFLH